MGKYCMKNPELAREWMQKADEDYGFAVSGIEDTEYYAQICFHFHQSAEKYLKAVIAGEELDFRPIHNLFELLLTASQVYPDIKEIEEACRYLSPFYIDSRYPVEWGREYSHETAEKAQKAAHSIQQAVKLLLDK